MTTFRWQSPSPAWQGRGGSQAALQTSAAFTPSDLWSGWQGVRSTTRVGEANKGVVALWLRQGATELLPLPRAGPSTSKNARLWMSKNVTWCRSNNAGRSRNRVATRLTSKSAQRSTSNNATQWTSNSVARFKRESVTPSTNRYSVCRKWLLSHWT